MPAFAPLLRELGEEVWDGEMEGRVAEVALVGATVEADTDEVVDDGLDDEVDSWSVALASEGLIVLVGFPSLRRNRPTPVSQQLSL